MVSDEGPPAFLVELEREACRFDFFQVLRKLECLARSSPGFGRSKRVADDPIRLGQAPSLGFPPSEIASFTESENGRPPRLSVHFFGLWGPSGPLPLHLTRLAVQWAYPQRSRLRRSPDTSLVDFADIFHHRLLSLLYRIWASVHPAVGLDQPKGERFSFYAGSLLGVTEEESPREGARVGSEWLQFAGHLARPTRTAEGLRSMVEECSGLPVEIEECVGQVIELPPERKWRLGGEDGRGSLGHSTLLGARCWDWVNKFRIVIGPAPSDVLDRFAPGRWSLKRLVDLVEEYVGGELRWDVRLVLKGDDVPPIEIGKRGRLGWSSWLLSGAIRCDVEDLLFTPMKLVTRPAWPDEMLSCAKE